MLLDEEVYQCAEAPVLSKQVDFDDALCHGVRRVCIVWVIREGMLSHFVLKEAIPDWVFKCVYGLSKLEITLLSDPWCPAAVSHSQEQVSRSNCCDSFPGQVSEPFHSAPSRMIEYLILRRQYSPPFVHMC